MHLKFTDSYTERQRDFVAAGFNNTVEAIRANGVPDFRALLAQIDSVVRNGHLSEELSTPVRDDRGLISSMTKSRVPTEAAERAVFTLIGTISAMHETLGQAAALGVTVK